MTRVSKMNKVNILVNWDFLFPTRGRKKKHMKPPWWFHVGAPRLVAGFFVSSRGAKYLRDPARLDQRGASLRRVLVLKGPAASRLGGKAKVNEGAAVEVEREGGILEEQWLGQRVGGVVEVVAAGRR